MLMTAISITQRKLDIIYLSCPEAVWTVTRRQAAMCLAVVRYCAHEAAFTLLQLARSAAKSINCTSNTLR